MLRTVRMTINAASEIMIQWVTAGTFFSNRHGLRPLPPHPPRHNQARYGKGGEYSCYNTDAERHGKTANRSGTNIEQHRSRDEGGDVGIHDGCKRAAKSRVDR